MKTNVKQTSIEAYNDLKKDFKLGTMQQKVLDVMEKDTLYTRRELAKLTDMETSSISGRVNELINYGYLQVSNKIKCQFTNKLVESLIKVV